MSYCRFTSKLSWSLVALSKSNTLNTSCRSERRDETASCSYLAKTRDVLIPEAGARLNFERKKKTNNSDSLKLGIAPMNGDTVQKEPQF